MSRKITSVDLSNSQKQTLRNSFSERTGKPFRSIFEIRQQLGVSTADYAYAILQEQYNDAIDTKRKAERARQARERRAQKKVVAKKIPVLMDHTYTKIKNNFSKERGQFDPIGIPESRDDALNRSLMEDLKKLSKKLVGVTDFYVQLFGQGYILHNTYSDPESIFWEVLVKFFFPEGSDPEENANNRIYNGLPNIGDSTRVVVLLSNTVIPEKLQQKYRDGGEKHCVIQPIYDLFMGYASNSKSDESRKKLERTARQIKKYEEIYPNGVPEENMTEIGKVARLCIIIHDILGNETIRYNPTSTKFIRFTNTRINHLDSGYLCFDDRPQKISKDELNKIVLEHDKNNEFYLLRSNQNGYLSIKSIRGCWEVENKENDIMKEFSESIDIHKCSYDALKYPEMNELIVESRIVNAAPMPLCEKPDDIIGAEHIDLTKAYTQHKLCPYYQGFMGVIHQWRKLNITSGVGKFLEEHLGTFQFEVTSKNNEFLNMFGIFSGFKYTLPSVEILYFIREFKMTCILKAGCWGSRFDFDYTDEMLENRRYCLWAGKNGMQNNENIYTFKGSSEWASHIATTIGKENVGFFEKYNIITCKIKNKVSYTRHHILSFITSYTRINMLEIIRKIPRESLIKVILDGLYFRGDIPDISLPHKKNKELKTHERFREFWYYPSVVDCGKWPEYKQEFDGRCILAGAGGTGKTHTILTDKGFVNTRYVVPMHSLGQEVRNKYNVSYDTMHKFIGKDCLSRRQESRSIPSVVLIDELTMHDGDDIDKAIEMYPESLIFVAGDIDSKQWFQCRNGNDGQFTNLWRQDWRYVFFEKDYRSLDDDLRKFKIAVRQKMREVFTDGKSGDSRLINKWVKENYKTISINEAMSKFVSGDIWIAGTHATNKKLLDNGVVSGFIKNKQISFSDGEKRGSFTIHSFQGLTISDKRVFISLDNFEYAMFYTAISRVRKFDQIILVN